MSYVKNQNRGLVPRNTILFAVIQPDKGELTEPKGSDVIRLNEDGTFTYDWNILEDLQKKNTRSKLKPKLGKKPHGELSLPNFYLKPPGVADAEPRGSALFKAALGTQEKLIRDTVDDASPTKYGFGVSNASLHSPSDPRFINVRGVWEGFVIEDKSDKLKIMPKLSTHPEDSAEILGGTAWKLSSYEDLEYLSIWMKLDQIVYVFQDVAVNKLGFNVTMDELFTVEAECGFTKMIYTARDALKKNIPDGNVTTIYPRKINCFSVGSRINICSISGLPDEGKLIVESINYADSSSVDKKGTEEGGGYNLENNYYIRLSIDGRHITEDIDCRGAVPSCTTPQEICDAINAYLLNDGHYGSEYCDPEFPVAYVNNNKVRIRSPFLDEEASVEIIAGSTKDASDIIFSGVLSRTFPSLTVKRGATAKSFVCQATTAPTYNKSGPYEIVENENNNIIINIDNIYDLEITLTAGEARTAQQIVAEINAAILACPYYGAGYANIASVSNNSVVLTHFVGGADHVIFVKHGTNSALSTLFNATNNFSVKGTDIYLEPWLVPPEDLGEPIACKKGYLRNRYGLFPVQSAKIEVTNNIQWMDNIKNNTDYSDGKVDGMRDVTLTTKIYWTEKYSEIFGQAHNFEDNSLLIEIGNTPFNMILLCVPQFKIKMPKISNTEQGKDLEIEGIVYGNDRRWNKIYDNEFVLGVF